MPEVFMLSEDGSDLPPSGAGRHSISSVAGFAGSVVAAAGLVAASAMMPAPSGVGMTVTHAQAAGGSLAGGAVLHFPR
jgi:hypothetical protein